MLANLFALIIASLLLAMVPGAGTAVLLRQSVLNGQRAGLATLAGMELGVLFWALAAAFGLSALLVASQLAYEVLRVVGVLVLFWLGVRALLAKPTEPPTEPLRHNGFLSGALVNTLNPKIGVFAISFLPQFSGPGQLPLVACAVVWVLVDTVWYLAVIALIGQLGRWLRQARVRQRLEQLTGFVLIGLGVRLALQSR
ncbi:LysE family translocator [Kutzneria viridogrisea]|uniref:Threonine/homoserine/homoserine lactone efflux protein n=1 Tax=Kutzneria viridogrisea TaxID=47990 RepID=A0ABR6BW20_9PSEU|nr:threonine/homoserine/homoserine lactone efflux protein [Kutzneria viridogrisea]